MSRKSYILTQVVIVLILIALAVLLNPSFFSSSPPISTLPHFPPEITNNVLINPGFEGMTHQQTAYYKFGDPTLYHDQFIEIVSGIGWVSWWLEGYPSSHEMVTGRPEIQVINKYPDEHRLHSGSQAQKAFTFFRPHDMGLAQRICDNGSCVTVYVRSQATHGLKHADIYLDDARVVVNGEYLLFEVWAHAWYSGCDIEPHYGKVTAEVGGKCEEIDWAHQYIFLGIDLTGGEVDPLSPEIVWVGPYEQYGLYGSEPFKIEISFKQFMPVIGKGD